MATELRTEHPHIVRVEGVVGGEPVIAGTRIGVAFIARLVQAGEEPAEIIVAYPHIAPAAVYEHSHIQYWRKPSMAYHQQKAGNSSQPRHHKHLQHRGRILRQHLQLDQFLQLVR